jgi:hypothetical protein
MKKINLMSGFMMLAVVATLFVACQKEQNGVSPQNGTAAVKANESVSGVAVNGSGVDGFITGDAATQMHNAYVQANPNGTQYVVFKIKDLEGFLQILKSKLKSDNVYVNFGVYTAQTANNPANIGKTTVYFSGDDNRVKNGSVQSNEVAPTATSTDYLNHGGIWP